MCIFNLVVSSTGAISLACSPRSYQEQMYRVSGLGPDACRSSFGLPEDGHLVWEFQCMRERVLSVRMQDVIQHKYHSLLPLDDESVSQVLGHKSTVYKALSTTDPFVYCLRRVDGFRLSNFDLVQDAIERWSDIKHPNIVTVRHAFATGEFQDAEGVGDGGSLVYVYDYIDLAQTLEMWHSQLVQPPSEPVLWDIVVPVVLALRLIHSRGLAARGCVCPSKILISSRFRIRLGSLGMVDAIQHHSMLTSTIVSPPSVSSLQSADLLGLASVLCWMVSGSRFVLLTEEEIRNRVSLFPPSIARVLMECTTGTAESIIAMSGAYIGFKCEQLELGQDLLMSELLKTIDIGRLNKILIKICTIADRVHLLDDWRWASTGDRYIVSLFRDYCFFQSDDIGKRPFVDAGHITDCLAKVDTGSMEPVMLMNRDGSSVLVTNYSDIKRCIESSFKEIIDAQRP